MAMKGTTHFSSSLWVVSFIISTFTITTIAVKNVQLDTALTTIELADHPAAHRGMSPSPIPSPLDTSPEAVERLLGEWHNVDELMGHYSLDHEHRKLLTDLPNAEARLRAAHLLQGCQAWERHQEDRAVRVLHPQAFPSGLDHHADSSAEAFVREHGLTPASIAAWARLGSDAERNAFARRMQKRTRVGRQIKKTVPCCFGQPVQPRTERPGSIR